MDRSAAKLRDADWHHDWLDKGRSCAKQSVFVDVLLFGARADVKTVVLWIGRGSNVKTFSSVKNMKFTMVAVYFSKSCRARVILDCLLAAVNARALVFFRHFSFRPVFMIRWTLDRWIPDSREICRTLRCVRGLSSWLNAIFSTTTFPAARAVRGRPLPAIRSMDSLRSIFANK